eukprot:514807_1
MEHVSNPAECELDWSINGVLISNISTNDNQYAFCIIGEEYPSKDIVNEMIPGETIIRYINGICHENVLTHDDCINSCWEFYKAHEMELMCNVKTTIINSNIESDCVGTLPINNIIHYTNKINLCFDDKWYKIVSYHLPEFSMTHDYVSSTSNIAPTLATPTIHCDARNSWIYAEMDNFVYSDKTVMSIETNYP